jgi:hypothetical protein
VPIKIQVVDANGVNYSSASLPVQAMSVVLVSRIHQGPLKMQETQTLI